MLHEDSCMLPCSAPWNLHQTRTVVRTLCDTFPHISPATHPAVISSDITAVRTALFSIVAVQKRKTVSSTLYHPMTTASVPCRCIRIQTVTSMFIHLHTIKVQITLGWWVCDLGLKWCWITHTNCMLSFECSLNGLNKSELSASLFMQGKRGFWPRLHRTSGKWGCCSWQLCTWGFFV